LNGMSVLPSTADVVRSPRHVRFVPISEVNALIRSPRQRELAAGAMVSPTSPDMRVIYLDATEHPGTVQEYRIMSAPGIVIINGELAYTGSVSDTVQPRLDMTREFSPNAKECPMKSHLLLTASGPLLILTSHESLRDPNLLEKLKHKGIGKFVAFEVPVSLARERYGGHFQAVESDLHETDDLRVLDFNGQRVFQLFRFDELGAPILQEQP